MIESSYNEIAAPDKVETSELSIKCSGCNKTLGKMLTRVGLAKEDHNFVVVCVCGDECYKLTTNIRSYLLTEEGYGVKDILTQDGQTTIYLCKAS